MIELFVKNGVCFNDVNNSARNLSAKIKNEKARVRAQLSFGRKTMYSKLLDARRHQQSSEIKFKCEKAKLAKVVKFGSPVWTVLMKQVKIDTEELWKEESEKAKIQAGAELGQAQP